MLFYLRIINSLLLRHRRSTNMGTKVIMISGGSKGLGLALTEYFLEQGNIVASFSRTKSAKINDLKKKYQDHFLFEAIDMRDTNQVKDFALKIYKNYQRIDALVNNASISLDQLVTMSMEQDVRNVIEVNVIATIMLTKSVARVMLKQKFGSIVNISSVVGQRGFKGVGTYSAAKAAMDGFTRSVARELGSKNIRVNSIAPGFLNTEMTANMNEQKRTQIIRRTPMGRLGEPQDIAGAIEFLISDKSRFITGQTLTIDGGLTS